MAEPFNLWQRHAERSCAGPFHVRDVQGTILCRTIPCFPSGFRESSVGTTSSARNAQVECGMTTEGSFRMIAFRPCGMQCGTLADWHGTNADEGVKSSSESPKNEVVVESRVGFTTWKLLVLIAHWR